MNLKLNKIQHQHVGSSRTLIHELTFLSDFQKIFSTIATNSPKHAQFIQSSINRASKQRAGDYYTRTILKLKSSRYFCDLLVLLYFFSSLLLFRFLCIFFMIFFLFFAREFTFSESWILACLFCLLSRARHSMCYSATSRVYIGIQKKTNTYGRQNERTMKQA